MAKRDAAELTRFLGAHQTRLSRLALVLTGDLGDAEDLVQDVMVKIVASWDRIRKSEDPAAYCSRMMINLARDRGRRRKRAATVDRTVSTQGWNDSSAGPAEVIDKITVAEMLAVLTARQRAVVYLRFYEDLAVADVAKRMNCSPGTVKSQTARALELLRQRSLHLMEARHD